jgi:hypothetical protein
MKLYGEKVYGIHLEGKLALTRNVIGGLKVTRTSERKCCLCLMPQISQVR